MTTDMDQGTRGDIGGDEAGEEAREEAREEAGRAVSRRTAGGHRRVSFALVTAAVPLTACLLSIDDSRLAAREAAGSADASGDTAEGRPDAMTATPFCESVDAALCVDFDREPLGSRWTEVPAAAPTRVFELSDTSFVSPPFAARIGVSVQSSGEPFFQDMVWDHSPPAKQLRIEFQVDLEALDGQTCTGLTRINMGNLRLDIPIDTSQNDCAAQEDVNGSVRDIPLTGAVTLGRWTQVMIVLDVAPSPHVAVTFDAVRVVDSSLRAAWQNPTGLSVHLGLLYVAPPTQKQILVLDDIRIDLQ